MSTQQNLRKRLSSIENVKHITEAIELVAGVKFKKLAQKMEYFRTYTNSFSEMIEHLASATEDKSHPLLQVREAKRIVVMIIGSDKGLCGSYNAHVFRCAEKFLHEHSSQHIELIVAGRRTVEHFKKEKWPIKESLLDYTRSMNEMSIKEWAEKQITSFIREEFDELWVVFTHFKSILSKEQRVERILPLQQNQISHFSKESEQPLNYIFEPGPQTIYTTILPYFFYTKMQSLLFESYAAELANRIISMKAATKNADEMIEKLTLIRNKERQYGITKEILEITAGAEGIK
jgi:F-type H+-transporting ATPase subunit gamma